MPFIRQIVLILAATTAASCSNESQGTNPNSSIGPGGSSLGIGRPCDLMVDAGPTQGAYNSQALECPSRLCLKPIDQNAGGRVVADTGAYCSSVCTKDSDCLGQTRDPNSVDDKRCKSYYECGVAFPVGPLCCTKLCICMDFVSGPLMTPNICDPSLHNGQTGCSQ